MVVFTRKAPHWHRRSRSVRRERSLYAKTMVVFTRKTRPKYRQSLSVYRNAGVCTTMTGVR